MWHISGHRLILVKSQPLTWTLFLSKKNGEDPNPLPFNYKYPNSLTNLGIEQTLTLMGIFKYFTILFIALFFLTAQSRFLPQNLRDLREDRNRCSSSQKSICSPHKCISQVSPDPNAEKAVVPEEEILDFELPPEPSNSRHVEIFVSAESRPHQPQNVRVLVERSESKKGGETKETSKAADSKGSLDPIWNDPRHNKMNP